MLLETKTELAARSKKLVILTNLMSNFTADSWRILNEAQHGGRLVNEQDWAAAFREWMLSVSEVVDDRRPIRRELNRPDDLANMHNKWTFPTALLYVLTVLTTCGSLRAIDSTLLHFVLNYSAYKNLHQNYCCAIMLCLGSARTGVQTTKRNSAFSYGVCNHLRRKREG
ncbi:hypothetical protein ANCCAN_02829 [Ancylostoma caninum]|uniref:Uncharacterized protein n=1 Tax=Ancylostoma caninum TaxID=29170 RepID=A0A368H363_ANCCA|nr:hypothetical protein ANCCAN_02829 [Ancylostoma caninum]